MAMADTSAELTTVVPPRAEADRHIAVFYLHGGGLVYGERDDLPAPYVRAFADAGYTLVCADYPLAPESAGGVDEAEEQWLEGTPTPTTNPGLGLFGDPVGVDEAEGVDGPVVPEAERQPGDVANN